MRALTLIGLVVLAGCAHLPPAPPPAAPGPLIDAKQNAIGLDEFRARAAGAQYVLIGEAHNNPCDHAEEARLTRLIAEAHPAVVGFEMVALDMQPVLDAYTSGQLSLEKLPKALDWRRRWGASFAPYAPIFAAARNAHAVILALNVPEEVKRLVRNGGLESLPPHVWPGVTPELIPPLTSQISMLQAAMAQHGSKLPKANAAEWVHFVRVQSLWDTEMAYRAWDAHRRLSRPVIVIAGGVHVEHGWGIPHRLNRFDPGATVLTVMPHRPGEAIDPTEADVYYLCPAVTDSKSPR